MFFLRNFLAIGFATAGMALIPLTSAANEASTPLDGILTPSVLWQTQGTDFFETHKEQGFRWLSAAQDEVQNTQKGNTLFGLPICQTLVRMKDGKIDHFTATFYNRGDMGELRKERYEELLRKVIEAISAQTGSKPKERGRDATSAVRAYGLEWKTDDSDYLLEYSFTKADQTRGVPYRAEFIRLEVGPKAQAQSFMTEAFSSIDKQEKYNGLKQVEKRENGDVFIREVPMVDQGEKGYCVVASVERVMRLYGMRVDSNELAQLANSSASEGTNVTAMTDSLKALTARFKIKVRTQVSWDYAKFERFIQQYNLQATRAKQPKIGLGGSRITLSDIYAKMDRDILRETKAKNRSEFTAFQRHIKAHVDKGVPMLWSVIMGVMPDPAYPRMGQTGGHMRLIIGYNDETQEIIYSDSWGMNFEENRMPAIDAFSITTNLCSFEPL